MIKIKALKILGSQPIARSSHQRIRKLATSWYQRLSTIEPWYIYRKMSIKRLMKSRRNKPNKVTNSLKT
jgi:hypothetical protein